MSCRTYNFVSHVFIDGLDPLWVEVGAVSCLFGLFWPIYRVFTLERLKVAEAFCVDLALLKVNRALS